MAAHGGLITAADLAGYRAVWRQPLSARWRGFEVVSAPPPSSGGFGVIQLLKMKAHLDEAFVGAPLNGALYVHLVAEMQKRVFADRAEYLGDPAFVDVPIDALIDDAYVRRRAAEVDPGAISALPDARPGLAEGRHTTHFSIVDRAGNAVANTYTINTSFGSGVVVPGAGFLLNNEMDDFSAKPGVPNFYGVVGNEANAIAPGKRPLSSMSPTLLLEDGRVRMAIGSPGGSTIFGSVFQTMAAVVDASVPLAEAVGLPRFHHQLLPPDLITYTPSVPLAAPAIDGLREMGYRVEPHGWEFGDLQAVWFDGEVWHAASDPRHRGAARVLTRVAALESRLPDAWLRPTEPFHIVDGVYYVGSEGLGSFLVTTQDGHVLIDGGLPETAAQIGASIAALGFDLADVKILLNSHAHFDHSGGLAELKAKSGARLYAHAGDVSALEGGFYLGSEEVEAWRTPPVAVDRVLQDGDVVELGGRRLALHHTPGHSRGCSSWAMTVRAGDEDLDLLVFCSATVAANRLTDPPQYEGIVDDYRTTFARAKALRVDVPLAAHPEFFSLLEKREQALRGGSHAPFVDRGAFAALMTRLEADFESRLIETSAALP
jgi:glyoxylase-like metal-dependent hydrolase (beta-lactamase superfamily II)